VSVLGNLLALSHQPLPDDERRDVNGELFRQFFTGLHRSDFIPLDEMQHWLTELHSVGERFSKAVRFESALRPLGHTGRALPGKATSFLYANELGIVAQSADPWMEKPTPGGAFDFLNYMHENLDIHQAIVYARCHQVEPYCRPYSDDDDNPLGYRWIRRDGERLTDIDRKATKRLDQVLLMCGTERDPTEAQWGYRRSPFANFIKKMVADSLTADACPIELVHGNDSRLLGWYNLDYRTVRLAYEDGYLGDDKIIAVQINPETKGAVVGYRDADLMYPVRNPRSSVYYGDYGRAELEAFTRAATAYMNAFTFNAAQQDRNSIPRGFLTLYGRFDQRALNSFRDQWNMLVRGASRRWAMPVLVSESRQEGGAQYTPVDTAISEMYLTKWITFLVSLLCALFGMDPVELAMEAFSSRASALSGKDTAEKLQSSHDRGFIPMMLFIANELNTRLVSQYSSRYVLTWVGLFPDDEERKQERAKLTLIVDEMRATDGVEPHPDPDIGQAPLNPVHMSVYSMKLQQRLMASSMGMPGQNAGGLPNSEAPLGEHYDERQPTGPKAPVGQKALPGPQGPAGAGGGQRALPAPGPQMTPTAKPGIPAKPTPAAGMQKAGTLSVTITRLGW